MFNVLGFSDTPLRTLYSRHSSGFRPPVDSIVITEPSFSMSREEAPPLPCSPWHQDTLKEKLLELTLMQADQETEPC